MKKLKNFLSIAVMIILSPIFLVSLVILINSYTKPNEIPSFFGWKPFIVLSGSMESEIFPGDVAVTKEIDTNKLKVGDVIAFRNGDIIVTHRIVEIVDEEGTKFATKGDNNNANDKNLVDPKNVEGIYMFKIQGLGNFAIFLQTPIGMVVCLSVPIIILILVQMSDNKKTKKKLKESGSKEKELQAEIEKLKKEKENLSNK